MRTWPKCYNLCQDLLRGGNKVMIMSKYLNDQAEHPDTCNESSSEGTTIRCNPWSIHTLNTITRTTRISYQWGSFWRKNGNGVTAISNRGCSTGLVGKGNTVKADNIPSDIMLRMQYTGWLTPMLSAQAIFCSQPHFSILNISAPQRNPFKR